MNILYAFTDVKLNFFLFQFFIFGPIGILITDTLFVTSLVLACLLLEVNLKPVNEKSEPDHAKAPNLCHVDDTEPMSYNLTTDRLIMTKAKFLQLAARFQDLQDRIENIKEMVNNVLILQNKQHIIL